MVNSYKSVIKVRLCFAMSAPPDIVRITVKAASLLNSIYTYVKYKTYNTLSNKKNNVFTTVKTVIVCVDKLFRVVKKSAVYDIIW